MFDGIRRTLPLIFSRVRIHAPHVYVYVQATRSLEITTAVAPHAKYHDEIMMKLKLTADTVYGWARAKQAEKEEERKKNKAERTRRKEERKRKKSKDNGVRGCDGFSSMHEVGVQCAQQFSGRCLFGQA